MTAVWSHTDELYNVPTSAGTVLTTEDHPFWNATDQQWQKAQHLQPGDQLHSSTVAVGEGGRRRRAGHGTRLSDQPVRRAPAWNMTVSGLHAYHVGVAQSYVLAHNSCPTGSDGIRDGVVYVTSDLMGGKPYVGQAKSKERYVARQQERARLSPNAGFEFEVVARAQPGVLLDRAEESHIRLNVPRIDTAFTP